MTRVPTALVVEDALDSALLLTKILKLSGYEAESVYDGASALAKAQDRPADVYFLDLTLPDIDGIELVKQLSALPTLKGATFVAVSGHCSPEDKARAKIAGFHHYMTKPFEVQAMKRLAQDIAPAL